MPSLELLITLIAGLGNLILGIATYSRNTKSATNKFFALFTFSVATYIVFNYLSLYQDSFEATVFWVKSVMAVAAIINLTFFLLAITYPNEKVSAKKPLLLILTLLTLGLILLTPTNLIFSEIEISNGHITPTPGVAMPLFLIHTLGLLGGGFYKMFKNYKSSTGVEKSQHKIFFLGAALMFSLVLFSNVFLVLIFNITMFVNLLPIYILIFTAFVSYAIIQHELFDLKVIAAQAFTAIIWIILFSKIFVSQDPTESVVDFFIFITMVVFGVLLVRSVKSEVEQRRKLEELTKKLKELDEQKDTFISMAAHELRAPMTAIKGFISMVMEGDTGDIPEKARGYLAEASAINDRLVRLVNNMLNVTRIEEGRMMYQMEEENLSNVARIVFSQFRSEAERKDLKYELEIPKSLRDKVLVDPDKLHEVVTNLLSNAVKYTDTGFVKLKLSQADEKTVRCEVVDTGPGISKEEQVGLFSKFYRAESTVGKTTGTGLGLYICKLLIERFDGKIGVDSVVGKGSTFWFELPLVIKDGSNSVGKDEK